MGTDMGYRDDFYVADNIFGYTGELQDYPTVYFRSDEQHGDEHGRITQDHDNENNIGRDVVKTNRGYSIFDEYFVLDEESGEGEWRSVEYEEFAGHAAFTKRHKSRGLLEFVDATTTTGDRHLLSQSIWRYTELKKNRRRRSI
jgi:hypothetical protein